MAEIQGNISSQLKPKKSGVFTFGSLLLSTSLIVLGAFFVSKNQFLPGGLLFFPGILGAIASYKLGFLTRKDQDLAGSHPIEIKQQNAESFSITADARTDRDILLSTISAAAIMARDRVPLPEPSGLVANGVGDSRTQEQARELVASINKEIEDNLRSIDAAITTNQKIDPAIVAKAPVTHAPSNDQQSS